MEVLKGCEIFGAFVGSTSWMHDQLSIHREEGEKLTAAA